MRTANGLIASAIGMAVALVTLPTIAAQDQVVVELASMMERMNVQLEADVQDYRVAMAEYFTIGGADAGNTVVAKVVGNKQLTSDFVPFDPRREAWSGSDPNQDDITYAIDETGDAVPVLGGLTAAQTDAAIARAMSTWDAVNCSTLPIVRNASSGIDIGVVAAQNMLGGSLAVLADVQHAGFRDINFAGNVLAVTFTFVFVLPGNIPTDVDGNGKTDTAFREIYYDPSFSWADNGVSNVDVETAALHEAGHGLSQNHFGTLFIKNDGSVHASPRAVLNPAYIGPLRDLRGTDNGGHCSNWANWPKQ
jgi:hypothetical protein